MGQEMLGVLVAGVAVEQCCDGIFDDLLALAMVTLLKCLDIHQIAHRYSPTATPTATG